MSVSLSATRDPRPGALLDSRLQHAPPLRRLNNGFGIHYIVSTLDCGILPSCRAQFMLIMRNDQKLVGPQDMRSSIPVASRSVCGALRYRLVADLVSNDGI